MKPRELYQIVSVLKELAGDAATLLAAATAAMRQMRGLPSRPVPKRFVVPFQKLSSVLARDDALGHIYQAINAPALESAYRGTASDGRKFTKSEIPAVTQLFTPRWVVEFLLHNTLGRSWLEMHLDSSLDSQWRFLLDKPSSSAKRKPLQLVSDLRILDPACGTMNFGIVAVEMLAAMYREELQHAGKSGWSASASVESVDKIPRTILQNNLHGVDIDPVALELAAQTLAMKLKVDPRLCHENLLPGDALFDPQIEKRCLSAFDVVVTNPPYLSARNLPVATVSQMKRRYPAAWRDACTCFIDRCLAFTREGGSAGILAMQSFMFIGSFQKLREKLSQMASIEAIAHFGPGLFDIGNPGTLQTAAIVMRRESDAGRRQSAQVAAARLVHAEDKQAALAEVIGNRNPSNTFRMRQDELLSSPRGAWVYWLSPQFRKVFANCPRLGDLAEPRQGLATTDNARFVRYWWEIEPTRLDAPIRASANTWFPYVKGGRFRRWYEAPRHRVNWADDGREIKQSIAQRYPYLKGRWEWVAKNSQFYGRAGITYSYLTAGTFSARLMPAGTIFDVAGSAIFPNDPLTLLAILNSNVAHELLHAINPTVNFQIGDLKLLPLPCGADGELADLARRAIAIQKQLEAFDETSPEFIAPPPWDLATAAEQHELARLNAAINTAVARRYGATNHLPKINGSPEGLTTPELARQWISFAIGCLLGRWGHPRRFEFLQIRPLTSDVLKSLRDELSSHAGAVAARQIEEHVGGMEIFLARHFWRWHIQLYHRRPVYWAFASERTTVMLLHDHATEDLIARSFREIGESLPRGWRRCMDDGVAINLAPLAEHLADRAFSKVLLPIARELDGQRYRWSQTAQSIGS